MGRRLEALEDYCKGRVLDTDYERGVFLSDVAKTQRLRERILQE